MKNHTYRNGVIWIRIRSNILKKDPPISKINPAHVFLMMIIWNVTDNMFAWSPSNFHL